MVCEFFHMNAHELPPTTNNESLDMSLAINSFQIKYTWKLSKKNLLRSLSDGDRFEIIGKCIAIDIPHSTWGIFDGFDHLRF